MVGPPGPLQPVIIRKANGDRGKVGNRAPTGNAEEVHWGIEPRTRSAGALPVTMTP